MTLKSSASVVTIGRVLFASIGALAIAVATGRCEALLDEQLLDGSRLESNRPTEAAVWVGREADVTVAEGVLSTTLGENSQKIWTYFTDEEPVKLGVGDKLTASVSFIPRKVLAESTSRSLRLGLFHDATSQRVEDDVNNDGGGSGAPWTDSKGYAVQVLITGGEYSSTKPFDLGKRVNMESPSLLGTSGDYIKMSGGMPATLTLDQEYRVTLSVEKVSDTEVELTTALYEGDEELSTWSMTDDGSMLGSEPIYDEFDQLFLRIADNLTTADQIDFTNFKIELTKAHENKE
jgi:hypothetical protein